MEEWGSNSSFRISRYSDERNLTGEYVKKILLDECLPKKLKREIISDSVVTVPEQGWAGTKNGKLLKLAEKNFDVFITGDQNLTAQQNLTQIDLIIIVLIAKDNRLNTLKPLVNQVNKKLELAKKGDIIVIE